MTKAVDVLIHVPIKQSSGKHSFQKWSCNTVKEHGKTDIVFCTATVQQNISSPTQAAVAQPTGEQAAQDHLSHPHSCTKPQHTVIIASHCFQHPHSSEIQLLPWVPTSWNSASTSGSSPPCSTLCKQGSRRNLLSLHNDSLAVQQ